MLEWEIKCTVAGGSRSDKVSGELVITNWDTAVSGGLF